MKQVKQRTFLILFLVLMLAFGTIWFCVKYVTQGSQWASFSANDHAFTDGLLSSGQVLDRNGVVLYDASSQSYNEDAAVREAALHAVGDEWGNISTSALSFFRDHLVGFNPVTGTAGGGHKLYLTIDSELNKTAYESLNGRKGVVAVYNYETGDILCMVSAPAYDPADPPDISDDDEQYSGVYLNRFLSGLYTPGSVFKIVTTAAALENLPDVQERTFTCTGRTEIGGDVITCPYVHGTMDFEEALANSCNCVFAQLAVELGGDTLQRYARDAGLLSAHKVSGIGTESGSFEIGNDNQLGWSGIGQYHDLVNPCAMITLMGAIAADGKAAQPHLIARETSMSGLSLIDSEKVTVGKPVWSADTYAALRSMMRSNVLLTYGQDRFGDLAVCAKSGTAEVEEGKSPHAWFNGFIDDADHPLAFVVLVENGGGGASVAGSIAATILQEAVSRD